MLKRFLNIFTKSTPDSMGTLSLAGDLQIKPHTAAGLLESINKAKPVLKCTFTPDGNNVRTVVNFRNGSSIIVIARSRYLCLLTLADELGLKQT